MAHEDIVSAQGLMGHNDIKTTRIYAHDDDRRKREVSAQWSAQLDRHAQPIRNKSVTAPEKLNSGGE